jgi:hypothetical protein
MMISRLRIAVAAVTCMACFVARADVTPEREQAFAPEIAPLVKKYCVECHSGDEPEGELRLDQYKSAQQIFEARTEWLKVLTRVRYGEMPPKDADKPSKEERQRLIKWLDGTLNDVNCQQDPFPGHVTLRRLNRTEYRNTIRDLLGVDYAPAQDFPADDVGYGFDNIGDVMTLPTILLEKYLAAADEITSRAIVTKFGPEVVYQRQGSQLRGDGERLGQFEGPRILTSNGQMTGRLRLSKSGKYEFRVKAYEDRGGSEHAKMAIRVEGTDKDIGVVDVSATEKAPNIYKVQGALEKGERRFSLAFTNDYYKPEDPDPEIRDRNLIVESVEVVGPLDQELELPDSHRKIFFVKPNEQTAAEEAARRVLDRFASRAFRRPATSDEVARLGKIAKLAREQGDSFEQSIQLAVQAVLVSPHFLFRVEADPPAGKSWRELTDYELATRLAYFLWSSMPDQELLESAERGELRSPDKMEGQVRRMLEDSKSQALVENFASQWLQLRKFDEMTISRRHFPSFSSQLRSDMRQETILFFGNLLRDDRSLLELLNAEYSFLNERLARHYGVPDVSGSEFRRVSLVGTDRIGLLSQGSVLTVTSNPTRTSPVKRGKWILDNILGEPPPPPPPNVPELKDDDDRLTGTLRQRMEQHRANPSCSVCHQRMDSLGFALENFDAVGAWRTKDGKFPIDSLGELPSGEKFSGPRELTKLLLDTKQDSFVRCVTEKMLIYALGRGIEYYDKCAVDKITEALAKNDNRFSTLVLEIVKSEPFQRQGAKRIQ